MVVPIGYVKSQQCKYTKKLIVWVDDSGLSRAWKDVARKEGWFGRGFEIRTMDEWADQLVEVTDDNGE